MVEKWTYAFFTWLDLIDWSFFKQLIINYNIKFFNKFWIIFFKKLKVKLLYIIAYYFQVNGSNKKINQKMKIILSIFIYVFKNLAY